LVVVVLDRHQVRVTAAELVQHAAMGVAVEVVDAIRAQ